ncbi:MAG: D-tyrosyl-tRNA(Tyr) deacylase [Candidatus Magasanikbacteria bacterium CG10_big_fil_rev_8_21_14_0_10_47_10]|uniref:D-aminoacyl-tRNA deacylase n=1 Tax=Candidatus Magasanikbacteria bacterium CG10_big_fil_rev_8_21_14_0_10_47_10 TaxID=1974652 RepID=A0A2H0TSG4_9BACT|nr:MAG: D-tyrosyl-tRNA(Tyr) deacylase [Candidatus Magasanikbacteria bacterium CG10_big_fil_rev_8_21_14_0_10_47_10]
MRVILQKVTMARVEVAGKIVGEIADGFVLLTGVTHSDTTADADRLAEKILKLRLFAEPGSGTFMEQDITQWGGGILVVPQFTLYGDASKGTRPSFSDAARPEQAREVINHFVYALRKSGLRVEEGEFGEHMEVLLVNDGPVTLILGDD